MLLGLISTIGRQYTPGGDEAFNLGVDFKGGTVVTAKFRGQRPSDDQIREALHNVGVTDPVIQASTDKPDEVLIKTPLLENTTAEPAQGEELKAQVQAGRKTVKPRSIRLERKQKATRRSTTRLTPDTRSSVPIRSVRSPGRSSEIRL